MVDVIKTLVQGKHKCLMAITGAFHTEGGIAALNRLVICSIAQASYQLDVFSLVETDATVDIRYVDASTTNYQVYEANKFRFTISVWQALLRNNYDLVFSDHVNLASILALASKLRICRYVVWLCGIEVFPPRPDREGKLGLKHAWKRLAISGHTQKSVKSRFPDLPITICDLALDPVRHVAVSTAELTESRPNVSLYSVDGKEHQLGPRVILHIGRMLAAEQYKGQDVLLRAFPAILGQFHDAQLVLAGHGDDTPRLRALAETFSSRVQARVFMPGFVKADLLNKIYQTCYLFAMPGWGEGFGIVYLEAMACAKPCLGGGMDAARYVIRDGVTGLIVDDPKSPEQVADKICWLFEHPEKAYQMGLAGHNLVHSYYLFPHFKERFWKALKE